MGASLDNCGSFGLLRPLGQYALAQFSNLLDRARFGLMGGATLRDKLIKQVGDLKKPPSHVRLVGETLVQTGRWVGAFTWQFIIHEPIYLYTIT